MKSEFELIESLVRRNRRTGAKPRGVVIDIGDDAAVLRFTTREDVVVTTDGLVEGTHYERRWLTPVDLGRRLAAVNLSDIAAMGAMPRFAFVSFTIPHDTTDQYAEEVELGAMSELSRFGARVVGGNVTSTDGPLVCDMTLIGACPRGQAWPRKACAGDAIVVAGELGAASAAVMLLKEGRKQSPLIKSYLRPSSCLDVAAALAGRKLVRGAIDVSDGFSADLIRLCTASDVGCELKAEALPIANALRPFCRMRELDPVEWVLQGGEDYALILSIPARKLSTAMRLLNQVRTRATIVGKFTRSSRVYRIVDESGARAFRAEGWDHRRKAPR